jgi:DNA invertase Pin-like site-specific DNA recombinase
MIYGYIRVSTDKQTVENQRFEIEKYCRKENFIIDNWIEETERGTKKSKERKLGGLIVDLKKGDTVIVSEITRLGRSAGDVFSIYETLTDKGATLIAIKDGVNSGNGLGARILTMALSMAAEIEREMISQRTKEALARRKADGVKLGRPAGNMDLSKLSMSSFHEKIMDGVAEKKPILRISEDLGLPLASVWRYIKRVEKEKTSLEQENKKTNL